MHTPGPWKRCDCDYASAHILGPNGGQVAEVGLHGDPLGEVDEANARLIAAAPALLAALDNALGNLEAITDRYADVLSEGVYVQAAFSIDEARAAIAQATGEGAHDA